VKEEESKVRSRLPVNSPTLAALDRSSDFYMWLAWTGILLAVVIFAIRLSDPLSSPFVPPISLLAADSNTPGLSLEVNAISPHEPPAGCDEEASQLFGMETEPVSRGLLLIKWRQVEAGIARDFEIVAQCQAGEPCPAPAQKLIELSREGEGRNLRARAGLINRAVDLAIRPVGDEVQWGVPDHWSEPLETLQSNSGDCEDYAIVKYAALLAAGFPKDAVKIVVWRNRLPYEDHAVLALRVDSQWLILDNRTLTLVRDTDVMRAIPEFVLDEQGVRRFVWSGKALRAVG
jgi:predicted transglutaminase-like cysteine proteinase